MAKTKQETVLDKKTKDKLVKELYQEIETDLKDDLCNKVMESVKSSIDEEYKGKLKEEISAELIDDIKSSIKKDEAKLSRKKSFKIFRLYVYIIVLLTFAGFLCYKLYQTGELKIFGKYEIVDRDNDKKESTNVEDVKDQNWYLKNYGHLLNNVSITNFELLKGNYLFKDIDITDKLAMTYNTLADSDITKETIIYTVGEDKVKTAFKNLFGSDETYRPANFSVKGLSYAYSTSSKSYIAVSENGPKDSGVIKNKIDNITESGGEIIITAYVALVKDMNVYNIYNVNEAVGTYTDATSLDSVREKLSKVEYHFSKIDKKYYISSVIKK